MIASAHAVKIVMIEDDEGHARLIEKNIRRAGVTNEIIAFVNGNDALSFLLGPDGEGSGHARLIEKNIRRAGVTNEIIAFVNGNDALSFLLGSDGEGSGHVGEMLLVLLDLNLPDMTGMDILARIRDSVHLKSTMVIILTTTDDPREVHRCYDLGANVYVPKPMQYEKFVNAIQQLGLFLSVMAVPEAQ